MILLQNNIKCAICICQ